MLGSRKSRTARPHQLRSRPQLECLESRLLLTFTPAQLRGAYGVSSIVLYDSNGNPYTGDGSGQTIAVVDAYREPNIAADLSYFSNYFGLPQAPSFVEYYPQGTPGTGDSGWRTEIALDVEWAHAIAPKANILYVGATSSSTTALYNAVNSARNYAGVSVVTMSWGATEYNGDTGADSYFTTPNGHNGVSFFAASGDTGGQHLYPAMSDNVVSVGGTNVVISNNQWVSEAGWSGSGGGVSAYSAKPSYQTNWQNYTKRTGPDVAYAAGSASSVYVRESYDYSGLVGVYGTSEASPQWAGIAAIADQGLNLLGAGTMDGRNQLLPALYLMARPPRINPNTYHDITTGSAGGNQASVGYDLVTGLGSPKANNLVPMLVAKYAPAPPGSGSGTGRTAVSVATGQVQDRIVHPADLIIAEVISDPSSLAAAAAHPAASVGANVLAAVTAQRAERPASPVTLPADTRAGTSPVVAPRLSHSDPDATVAPLPVMDKVDDSDAVDSSSRPVTPAAGAAAMLEASATQAAAAVPELRSADAYFSTASAETTLDSDSVVDLTPGANTLAAAAGLLVVLGGHWTGSVASESELTRRQQLPRTPRQGSESLR
jgi:hypothetical protein